MVVSEQRVGRYRVVRRLGAGAFATVWLGHDDQLDIAVAIKVLAENWADNADVNRRFVDKAKALRRIRDPRLVQVLDAGTLPDGRGYFVMDYADSGTLAELVKATCRYPTPSRTRWPPPTRCRRCIDHGLLHRDIKPSNLLRDRDARGSSGCCWPIWGWPSRWTTPPA